jgi:hypothetical protein
LGGRLESTLCGGEVGAATKPRRARLSIR